MTAAPETFCAESTRTPSMIVNPDRLTRLVDVALHELAELGKMVNHYNLYGWDYEAESRFSGTAASARLRLLIVKMILDPTRGPAYLSAAPQ